MSSAGLFSSTGAWASSAGLFSSTGAGCAAGVVSAVCSGWAGATGWVAGADWVLSTGWVSLEDCTVVSVAGWASGVGWTGAWTSGVATGAGCASALAGAAAWASGAAGWAAGAVIGCWIVHGWTSVVVGCWVVEAWASGVATETEAVGTTTGTGTATGLALVGWAAGAGCTTGAVVGWVAVGVVFTGVDVVFEISFWFACSNNFSCNDGSLLTLNEIINKHNQSNIVEIQIHTQTTALASSLSENAITKNNIINNIHNIKIHGQNLLSSLFVRL